MLKHHLKKKQTEKKKIIETYEKIASLIHELAKQDFFLVEKLSYDNNEQKILKIFKAKMQSTFTIVSQTISRNGRDFWRKERKMMIKRKKVK